MARIAVTGATKGIGRSVARKFAREGHEVACCARSKADLEKLEEELVALSGGSQVLIKVCDVGKEDQLSSFYQAIKDNWGGLDVLVNNAGVFLPGEVHKEEEGVFEKTMATNLTSVYKLCRLAIPDMLAQGSGHIFNLCSTASTMAYTNGGSYCISKFALYGLTKVLRAELAERNIRVTAVLPGATYTNSWEGSGLPEERFMNAEDVADMIYHSYKMPAKTVIEELVMRPQLGDI